MVSVLTRLTSKRSSLALLMPREFSSALWSVRLLRHRHTMLPHWLTNGISYLRLRP